MSWFMVYVIKGRLLYRLIKLETFEAS